MKSDYRSKKRDARLLVVWAAAILLAGGAAAQTIEDCPRPEGRECVPTDDNCPDVNETYVAAQLGGEGSVGTEDDCTASPARDADGNIVEADLEFTWNRASGQLTLLATNVSCPPDGLIDSASKITVIWFNTPLSDIADCWLLEARLLEDIDGGTWENVCAQETCTTEVSPDPGWMLADRANGEGCLGAFDWQLQTTEGQNKGVPANGQLEVVLQCAGPGLDAITACDIATDGSEGEIGERLAQVAMHFQRTDDEARLSNKVSSNCQEELFVDLASFTATPDDSRVVLDWSTMVEVDNAGFRILRRNLVSGEIDQINQGLIPAAGDINMGAFYQFVDETAINGVEYEYVLVDVELSGRESAHPGVLAVPNPQQPRIRLLEPAYGSSELRLGDRPEFAWEPDARGRVLLLISSDPTFLDREVTMAVPVGTRASQPGRIELNLPWTRTMEQIALGNRGVVYWRVEEASGTGASASATFSLSYGVLDDAAMQSLGHRPTRPGRAEHKGGR